jgi:hypothetical protein
MEAHNTTIDVEILKHVLHECTTNPEALPQDASALAKMMTAIETHNIVLPETAKLALLERAMELGNDDLASHIDGYATPRARGDAVEGLEPMQRSKTQQPLR